MESGDRDDVNGREDAQHPSTSQAFDDAAKEAGQNQQTQMPVRGKCGISGDGKDSPQEPSPANIPTKAVSHAPNPTPISKTPPTMEELANDAIRCYILMGIATDGPHIADCFVRAPEYPPVTPESLAELDTLRMVNNPRLRYDINFDRDIHFRPNLDGSKGRNKMIHIEAYWKAVEGEVYMYEYVLGRLRDPADSKGEAYWEELGSRSAKRLPKLVDAIRNILHGLVPDYDRNAVTERLDTAFTMQQIKHGVYDLVDLADWLKKMLVKHCAPMRDLTITRMEDAIKQGAAGMQSDTLVVGIRQLLNILEAMKLDVANHQIRQMRPSLVAGTVNFHQSYNAYRISNNKVDTGRARFWLECEVQQMITKNGTANPIEALGAALLRNLLFDPLPTMYPQTFFFDIERLEALRADLHSDIYHDICREILTEVTRSPISDSVLRTAFALLGRSVKTIVGTSSKFEERIDNIATEIMRITLMLEGQDHSYDAVLLNNVQERLTMEFRTTSPGHTKRSQEIFDRILPKLQVSVAEHIGLSALDLQARLVPLIPPSLLQPPYGFGAVLRPPPNMQAVNPDDDAIRKLTHMIVLHWYVWADLVYLAPYDEDDVSSDGSQTPPSPSSAASTVPLGMGVDNVFPFASLAVTELVPVSAPSPIRVGSCPNLSAPQSRSESPVSEHGADSPTLQHSKDSSTSQYHPTSPDLQSQAGSPDPNYCAATSDPQNSEATPKKKKEKKSDSTTPQHSGENPSKKKYSGEKQRSGENPSKRGSSDP